MFILIGFALAILVLIVEIVCMVMGAIWANKGKAYRYPFIIRLVK